MHNPRYPVSTVTDLEYSDSASSKTLDEVNQFNLVKLVFDARDYFLMVNRCLNASRKCKQNRNDSIHE